MNSNRSNKRILAASAAIGILAATASPALAADVLIYSNEIREENANTMILDFDDTGGDVVLQFGETLGEQLLWDDSANQFVFTDDVNVQGNISQGGNSLTLDSDNAGAGADVDIIANQGADSDGTLRYNATLNRWEISNDGGAFESIATGSSGDFLSSGASDNYTSGTLTFDAGTTLDVNGTLDASGATDIIIPNTESNTFVLDNDNTGGDVTLQFGQALNETITWDSANSEFDFSDDINVTGNIAVSGTVDGVDVSALNSTVTGHLNGGANKHDATEIDVETAGNITTVANLETNLAAFDTAIGNRAYTNDNVVTDGQTITASIDALDSSVGGIGNRTYTNDFVVADNETLTASVDKLDTAFGNRTYTNDNVVTDGQTITASIDALDTALGNATEQIFVNMNDLTVQADGSNNRANLYNGSETGVNPHQYYTLRTRRSTLQDLDVKIKVKLPEDFVNFTGNTNDISFFYRTTNGVAGDNAIDILVEDDDGDDAFTAADGQGLVNAAWTEHTDEFDGGSFDPAAGEYIYVTIKGYGRNNGGFRSPFMGELVINYTGSNR